MDKTETKLWVILTTLYTTEAEQNVQKYTFSGQVYLYWVQFSDEKYGQITAVISVFILNFMSALWVTLALENPPPKTKPNHSYVLSTLST